MVIGLILLIPSPVIATASMTIQEAREGTVLHCKSKLLNYHNLSRLYGIIFVFLLGTFGEYYFISLFEKRGL